jgi:hypothetical protein
LFSVKLTYDTAIHFEDLEFIADRFNNWSLSPEGALSGTVVRGMARSGSPSLHAILEESPSEHDSASSERESSSFPLSGACNTVISVIPIAATPPSEEIPMPQTIPVRPPLTATPTPLPEQLMARQEERRRTL